MKPGRLDLPIIWRGCTYLPVTLTWLDADGNPFNLTGWTPFAQTRNFDLMPVVTDALRGVTQISLTREQTGPLKLGVEKWDWVWKHNGTTSPPVLSGVVPIKEPLTQTS